MDLLKGLYRCQLHIQHVRIREHIHERARIHHVGIPQTQVHLVVQHEQEVRTKVQAPHMQDG